jgi:ariadne-1
LEGKDKIKYIKFHCKSYTDDTKNMKWCPSPGCKFCIEDLSYAAKEVQCECGNIFCFKCNQDSHRPCTCDTALKWNMKNKSESENITWMIANTKNCPKCQRPIEKNQGCNHMTCNMCKHEFCWMCMGDWKEHGSATGGYYKCNKYEELKKDKNALTKAEEKREQAQHDLKKYMFYYERYNNHANAGEHAKEMQPKIKILIEKLNSEKCYPIAELGFLEEALQEVVRCRKVLKWTYAYAFYLQDEKEKALLETAQEMLEKN